MMDINFASKFNLVAFGSLAVHDTPGNVTLSTLPRPTGWIEEALRGEGRGNGRDSLCCG